MDISTYARVHYYVAQALLAKLYLNAAIYTGTPQWEKANAAVDEIIESGLYNLAPDYFENFQERNESSPENIFVIPYEGWQAHGLNIAMSTLHFGSQATYNLESQPWNGYCTLQEFYESFEEEDVRREMFIVGPQYALDGSPVLDERFDDPDGPQVNYTPKVGDSIRNTYRESGARIGKFEIGIGSGSNMNNDYPVFRYGDMLMIKAEVEFRLGNTNEALYVCQYDSRTGRDVSFQYAD